MVPQNAESPGGGSKELRFRIDSDVHAWLRMWARRWGVSVSSAARMMLLRGVQDEGGPVREVPDESEGPQDAHELARDIPEAHLYGPPPRTHVHEFEFQRERAGKPGSAKYLYACACGAQEWRNE